jgi:ubiquinone/menaquinone biosynthesis C-methylase UbiE
VSAPPPGQKPAPETAWALRLFDKSILKQAKYRALVRQTGDTNGRDCLDLGSDNGVISYLLRARGGRWTSADLSEKAVASIRSLVGSNVYRIDGARMPFADASFDLVVIIDLLEHVRDDDTCVAEIARILRPGGELVVNTPHAKPRSLLRMVRGRLGLTDEWHGHVRPGYTRDGLQSLLGTRFSIEGSATYSKFFSEALDVALNSVYLRSRGHGAEDGEKGTVVTAADLEKSARQFRVLAKIYPLLWLWAKLDFLCVGTAGYYLIVKARKIV